MPCVSGMSVQAPDDTEKCISTPMKASAQRTVMIGQLSLRKRSNSVFGVAHGGDRHALLPAFELRQARRRAARGIAHQRRAHDFARDRAGDGRAGAAVFDNDSARIARLVPGAEAAEERVVAMRHSIVE